MSNEITDRVAAIALEESSEYRGCSLTEDHKCWGHDCAGQDDMSNDAHIAAHLATFSAADHLKLAEHMAHDGPHTYDESSGQHATFKENLISNKAMNFAKLAQEHANAHAYLKEQGGNAYYDDMGMKRGSKRRTG